MKYFVLYKQDGSFSKVKADGDVLEIARREIGCDYVEMVRLKPHDLHFALLVDEDGRFKKDAILNPLASLFAECNIVRNALLVMINGEELDGVSEEKADRLIEKANLVSGMMSRFR